MNHSSKEGTPAPGRCVHELFATLAESIPDTVAVSFGDACLTYGELHRRSHLLASFLQTRGVRPEVCVGSYLEPSLEAVIGLLGILKAGGVYVPVEPTYPGERVAFMLRDAQVRLIVTQQRLAGSISGIDIPSICLDTAWHSLNQVPVASLRDTAAGQNLAYIIYTSGSTGRPKGTLIEHHGLSDMLAEQIRIFGIQGHQRVAQFASLSFDASISEIGMALLAGACLCPVPQEQRWPASVLAQYARERAITTITLGPAALSTLFPEELSGVQTLISAGEELLVDVVEPWLAGRQVFNAYGPTEATVCATISAIQTPSPATRGIPIGQPLRNTEIYVLNERLRPVAAGAPGTLYIGGSGLARGYLHRPELVAEKFVPHPFSREQGARLYNTGDIVCSRSDGAIVFLGRADQQAKLRGYRVEPGEVEVALRKHPGIREAVALIQETTSGDRRLVAHLVLRAKQELSTTDLQHFLRSALPDYLVPAAFFVHDSLPLTPNGKLNRQALLTGISEGLPLESATVYEAPHTPLEEVVAEVWAGVFERERIGIHDNFFALGGHSLLAARIIARLQTLLQQQVSLRALFDHPTVAGLALALQEARTSEGQTPVPLLQSRARTPRLPLSFAQERLWFLAQLEPLSPAYNIPCAFRLTGALNLAGLESSLYELIQRHEVLRTHFSEVQGLPIQIVAPAFRLSIPLVDLMSLDDDACQEQIRQLTDAHARLPFDLMQGPLLRLQILRVHAETHILLLCLHHIICDGWSITVFFQELTQLYTAFCRGDVSPLPALTFQYADFALWQREWLRGEILARHMAYWKQQLADLPQLTLQTEYPRPAMQQFVGASQTLHIPQDLAERIKRLSQREGATLFMTLLTAFQVLLARYSGQNDIAVGTTVAGRSQQQMESALGFFVNTLVLRVDLADNPDFRTLLRRVREITLQGYAHQDLPFAQLVKALNPERSLSYNPLFQVLVNMLNFPSQKASWPALTAEVIWPGEVEAKFDMTLYIDDHPWDRGKDVGEGIYLELVYNARLFRSEHIGEMLRQFSYLLMQIVNDADRAIAAYSLLTPTARDVVPDPTLSLETIWVGAAYSALARHAQQMPGHSAVIDAHESISYQELEAASNQLAHYLLSRGIQSQDVVAIYGHRSAALVLTLVGVLKAGAAFLILDPAYPPARLTEYLRLAEPRAWLQIEAAGRPPVEIEQLVAGYAFRLVLGARPTGELASCDCTPPDRQVDPEDLAYIAFTSGSTGQPKAIAGKHRSLSRFLPWYEQTSGFHARDRFSMLSGLSHDPLHRDIFAALWVGATICIPDLDAGEGSASLGEWMRQENITIANLTPAMLQLLIETRTSETLPALRYVLTVGDVIQKQAVERLYELAPFVQCIHLYGATETQQALGYFIDAEHALADDDARASRESIPLGRGLPGVQLLVLNQQQALAGIGESGEICVRSPYLARGYLKNEALTRERFSQNHFTGQADDRFYRTGDLGRYRADGMVEYLGRRDRQVKLRGLRIELGEIEGTLAGHPLVRRAAVTLREDAHRKYLAAYIVPHEKRTPAIDELRAYVRERLPTFMLPAVFSFLEALPLSANGKVDYARLPALERTRLESAQSFIAARTPLESTLVGLWSEALHLSQVGMDENFFADLGCDSLQCLQLVARARQAGISLTVKQIFQHQTLAELASAIQDGQPGQRARTEGADTQDESALSGSDTRMTSRQDSAFNPRPAHPSLVGRNLAGTRRPFFCVHAISGEVVALANLASAIGSDQPFYIFRAAGLDGERDPFTSIEAMAAHYIEAMRMVDPCGPYFIGGWSFGGLVAFEMALQLQQQGREIAYLALIDTYAPTRDREPPATELFAQVASYVRGIALRYQLKEPAFTLLHEDDLQRMSDEEQLMYMINAASLAGADWIPSDKKLLEAYLHVTTANEQASYRYQPQSIYHRRLTYFRAINGKEAVDSLDDIHGWQQLTSTPLDVQDIPATHENIVHQPEALARLVERMRSGCDLAER